MHDSVENCNQETKITSHNLLQNESEEEKEMIIKKKSRLTVEFHIRLQPS